MDSQPTAPGEGSREPLVADQPLPPGSNAEEIVDELDARIRQGGPEEVREADQRADAVEDHGEDGDDDREEEASDSGSDPTDDGREHDEPA